MKHWKDKLKGTPAFIIGNAPTIENVNLDLIKDYFSIGINRSYRDLDPTILIWQDSTFLITDKDLIKDTFAIKCCPQKSDPKRLYYNFYTKHGTPTFNGQPHKLIGCANTSSLATQLAYALGCTPLVLVGIDCKMGKDGKTNAFGRNKYWHKNTLNNCNKTLQQIKELCPVPVLSASWNDTFPHEDLPDIIQMIDPNKEFAKGRKEYVNQLLGTSSSEFSL